jgi:hypothetical protein
MPATPLHLQILADPQLMKEMQLLALIARFPTPLALLSPRPIQN